MRHEPFGIFCRKSLKTPTTLRGHFTFDNPVKITKSISHGQSLPNSVTAPLASLYNTQRLP
jgi:hypothetical protein